jgi:hypothetical protein
MRAEGAPKFCKLSCWRHIHYSITVIYARRNVGRGVTIPCTHRDTDAIGNGRDMWRTVSYVERVMVGSLLTH